MERIGIRSLRQHASAVLRRVHQGESVEVTDRGQGVAILTASRGRTLLDALEAAGRLTPADGDVLDLGLPVAPKRGREVPSKRLARLRAVDR